MVGILIVAHGAFGEALIHCASHVLGKRPMDVRQLGVTIHDDPEAILPQAHELVRQLDQYARTELSYKLINTIVKYNEENRHSRYGIYHYPAQSFFKRNPLSW